MVIFACPVGFISFMVIFAGRESKHFLFIFPSSSSFRSQIEFRLAVFSPPSSPSPIFFFLPIKSNPGFLFSVPPPSSSFSNQIKYPFSPFLAPSSSSSFFSNQIESVFDLTFFGSPSSSFFFLTDVLTSHFFWLLGSFVDFMLFAPHKSAWSVFSWDR